ncbi:alpha/beta-hydrolase [Mycena vulgaris]|nr:alpha/beta-hydrolase [Mycena vulgaris]
MAPTSSKDLDFSNPDSFKDYDELPSGFNYHYFYSPAKADKPTLVFLHGFPSNAYECWHKQVPFFVKAGYGVLAPDLLGYGGTSKPKHVACYAKSKMALDIISIMDHENINTKVFAIGHDWGCALTSGLATFHPERFAGFAFLALGYLLPNPNFKIEEFYQAFKGIVGRECFGYWAFFNEETAYKVIEQNMKSFMSLLYPKDAVTWETDMAPSGKLKEWIQQGRVTEPPSSLPEEDLERQMAALRKGGMRGPLYWYKQYASGAVKADDKLAPPENYSIKKPVFLAAADEDYICVPKAAILSMSTPSIGQPPVAPCPNLTVVHYKTDHWVQLAAPKEINDDLLAWIDGKEISKSKIWIDGKQTKN